MTEPWVSLLVGGTLLLIGFAGALAFERFRIPDFIILIGLGVALAHVPVAPFGPNLVASLGPILPAFTNLTIAFILFEGGLSLNLQGYARRMPAILIHLAVSAGLVMGLVWVISTRVFGLDPITALVLAGAFCGPSASITLGFVPQMRMRTQARTALSFDAVGTNVLAVIVVLFAIQPSAAEGWAALPPYLIQIEIAVALAAVVGVVWRFASRALSGHRFVYMASAALALVVYGIAQGFLNGNGAVAAFVLGLVLAYRKSDDEKYDRAVASGLKAFQSEVTFGLRTFFFVYLGLLVSFRDVTVTTLAAAGLFTLAFLAGRAPSSVALRRALRLGQRETRVVVATVARGMTDVVLVLLALQSGAVPASDQSFLLGVLPLTILASTLATAGLLGWAERAPELVEGHQPSPQPATTSPKPTAAPAAVPPPESPDLSGFDLPDEPLVRAPAEQEKGHGEGA